MLGKHTDEAIKTGELERTITRKDREITDIKYSVADVLEQIREINESNTYHDESIRKRKISELCTDTRYELLVDELKKEDTSKLFGNEPVSSK